MTTSQLSDARIVQSWLINAVPWTMAVRERQIESRKLITDQAIVDTILGRQPSSVLDLGCGEGWLVRELATQAIRTVGVDVIPDLVEVARRAGGGEFHTLSYEEIASDRLKESFDVVACNFSLLGKESVEGVFQSVSSLLNANGAFIVQTLHPGIVCGDLLYQDGWREGSWTGFSADFSDPAPWYFRTTESWVKLFLESGFQLREIHEPLHPQTQKPASIIFVGETHG